MPLYKDTDIQNLIALINQDNPQLPFPLDEVSFIYGAPQVIATLPNGHNTRVRVTPKGSSPYRGAVDITYRRIDLTTLFRSVKVEFTRWINNGTNMTHAMMVPILNQLYGINLDTDKTTLNASWTVNSSGSINNTGQVRTLSAAANNYFYVGSVSVYWHRGQQELGLDILTTTELAGATWPGGNDFVAYDDRSLHGEFLLSGIDVTEHAIANNWALGTAAGTSLTSAWQALFNEINAITGLSLSASTYNADTNPQGLAGYTVGRFALPHASYPMANKPGFAGAYIIHADNHPVFKGKIILYYNV